MSDGSWEANSMHNDIGVLLSDIDWLMTLHGEDIEGEDAAILNQIRAAHQSREKDRHTKKER